MQTLVVSVHAENWVILFLKSLFLSETRRNRNRIFVRTLKINIPATFKRLFTIQTDIRNVSENKKFKRENDAKLAKDVHFTFFFLEKPLPLKKTEKNVFRFFYNKNRNTHKFHFFKFKKWLRKYVKKWLVLF